MGRTAGFNDRSRELCETHGWQKRHRQDEAKRPDCLKHGSHYIAAANRAWKNFRLRKYRVVYQLRSSAIATELPPPRQSAATPLCTLRRCISCNNVVSTRAPLAPMG